MTNKLPVNLSVYLNSLRILSVFSVVLISAQTIFRLQIFQASHLYGNETAIVFFVISGFLTQYTFRETRIDRKEFTLARTSKIYSAAFTVILICLATDYLGSTAKAQAYGALSQSGVYLPLNLFDLMHYLTFTTESWTWHIQLGSMSTYWLLSYLVMFYVFFGFTAFRKRPARVLMGIWFLLTGPHIALYLATWLLGVETYNYMRKYRFGLSFGPALGLFGFTLTAFIMALIFAGPAITAPMQHPAPIMVIAVSYLYHLAIAIIVALNLISFERLFRYAPPPSVAITATLNWLSGANLTLYLLHPTLMAAAVAFYPGLIHDPLQATGATIAIVMACFLAAEFGERRRVHFRGFFEKLLR